MMIFVSNGDFILERYMGVVNLTPRRAWLTEMVAYFPGVKYLFVLALTEAGQTFAQGLHRRCLVSASLLAGVSLFFRALRER